MRHALWVSTSTSTRGGIATFVRQIRSTPFWYDWTITHVATHRNGTILQRIAAFLTGFARICFELLSHRPDVIHIHVSVYGSFARKSLVTWTAIALGVPVVLHLHGSHFDEFVENMPTLLQRFIRGTLERADAVIALGSSWATRLREIAPRARITIVPNAIRTQEFIAGTPTGPVSFAFLGEVGERKGAFVLLEAWSRVIRDCRGQATLTIAGDGENDRARERARTLGITDTVDMPGWLSPEDAFKLLSAAQVLVLPSLNEGQPMAILEAMERGICVVASDVGGIPELVGDTGILIKPGDVDGLADALRTVILHREVATELGARARRRVENEFDIAVATERLDLLYRGILAARCGRPNSKAT